MLVGGWFMVFQQYFSYIMAVSFIGGGDQSNRRRFKCTRAWEVFLIYVW